MNFLSLFQLLWCSITILCGQGRAYGRSFYSSVATPTSHYTIKQGAGSSTGFVPLNYKSDLMTEESKRMLSSKYSKTKLDKGYGSDEDDFSSEGYTSDEYSSEGKHIFTSKENDSREYTIGTHIRVQHPITIPKKNSLSYPTKSTKYTSLSNYPMDLSHEEQGTDSFLPLSSSKKQKYSKHYESDPFQVISPPKSKLSSHHHSSSPGYGINFNAYEPEAESYDNPDFIIKHLKTNARDRFKTVASKKQIEKYIEDQEKLLDDALKLRILKSPTFQKLLKTAEKEQQFKVDFGDEYTVNVPLPYRDSISKNAPLKSSRTRRRPPKSKTSILSKPSRKYRSAFVIDI